MPTTPSVLFSNCTVFSLYCQGVCPTNIGPVTDTRSLCKKVRFRELWKNLRFFGIRSASRRTFRLENKKKTEPRFRLFLDYNYSPSSRLLQARARGSINKTKNRDRFARCQSIPAIHIDKSPWIPPDDRFLSAKKHPISHRRVF